MEFEMLKITGSNDNRESCNDFIVFVQATRKYGQPVKNDSANKKKQDHLSPTTTTQYRNAVLEAYGVVPMIEKECGGFFLPTEETKSQKYRGNGDEEVRDGMEIRVAMERPSNKIHTAKWEEELKKTKYKEMVLKAYGVLPVQECFSVP